LTPVRARARRGEGDRLRGEILTAAEELLIETADSSAVSIRAIADRVGITPPSVYRHFADKDELLAEVCAQVFVRLDRAMQDAARPATDPIDEMRRKSKAYVDFALEFPEHYRLVFMRPEVHLHADQEAHGRMIAGFEGPTIAEGNAFGHLVDSVERMLALQPDPALRPDVHATAVAIWTAVHGIVALRIAKPLFPWPSVDDQLDLICRPWRAFVGCAERESATETGRSTR
jgi:AcrR family transcriptional regulator